MTNFTKVNLSGSSGGSPIAVAATSSYGTTIHTTGTLATVLDEIWLYANNIDTTDRKLSIEYGDGTSYGTDPMGSPNHLIEITIPAESGLVLVIPGLLLSSGRAVYAFAATANVINISGYVNRIS